VKIDIASVTSKAVGLFEGFLRPRVLWFACLGISLMVSAGAVLARPFARPATLWFPSLETGRLLPEVRYIRGSDTGELPEALVARELLLGPARTDSGPIAMPGTDLRLAHRSANALYVDVSAGMLFGRLGKDGVYRAPPVEPATALESLRRTMSWNFPRRQLVLTVEGREPHAPDPAPETAETVKKE